MSKVHYAVGLMSGTSLDGVDAALVSIDSERKMTLIGFKTLPIEAPLNRRLKQAMDKTHSNSPLLCSLNFELGYLFVKAIKAVCQHCNFTLNQLDFIASHGQTIYHLSQPSNGQVRSTLQLGEPAVIAYETRVPVVSNFRTMDIAAGGEGAPLVPFFDYMYYRGLETVCLLNIGGIANVTLIPGASSLQEVIAFDTGPGNMVIDGLMKHFFDRPYDEQGSIAKEGTVNESLLRCLLDEPFIHQPPPKSTGREQYGDDFLEKLIHSSLKKEDLIATLTEFTVASILVNIASFDVAKIIVSGGGVHNKTLMTRLQAKFQGEVCVSEAPDAKEAMAFALLGYETLHRRPSNVPSATGAKKRVVLGSVTYP